MENGYKKVTPKDVFITATKAGELKWRVDGGAVVKNRPSGNDFMDTVAHLLSVHMMQKVWRYEKALGLGAGVLNQITIQCSGMTFLEWRNQYILLAAKELLVETDYGLNEIGKRLGFASINSFSKWFIRTEKEKPIFWRCLAKRKRNREEAEQFLEWEKTRE